MKPEVMLELLEATAEQLAIKVSYEPIQTGGIASSLRGGVAGGLCRVNKEWRVIVDKRATSEERVATLATALATMDTTELELPRQVNDLLRLYRGGRPRRAA